MVNFQIEVLRDADTDHMLGQVANLTSDQLAKLSIDLRIMSRDLLLKAELLDSYVEAKFVDEEGRQPSPFGTI